jgi:CrcB protein
MLWYVALGSAMGGVGRWLLGGAAQRLAPTFPVGTLAVNVLGAFVVGLVLRFSLASPDVTPEIRAFLAIGVCGGFTTFSTFTWETFALLEEGAWTRAGLNVALSVLLCLVAVALGAALGRALFELRLRG